MPVARRATVNLIKTWRARCTDLLEEASLEVGLDLTPLSAPELFLKKTFRIKTAERARPFTLAVDVYLGVEGGQHWFRCVYQRWTSGTSRGGGEVEKFSKENLLALLLDDDAKKEALHVRPSSATRAPRAPAWLSPHIPPLQAYPSPPTPYPLLHSPPPPSPSTPSPILHICTCQWG